MVRSTLVLVVLLVLVAALAGCAEPTVPNPWQPEAPPLTAEALAREGQVRVDAAERHAKEEAERLAREADARLAEFEDAVADLEGDTAAQLRDLKRRYEADARAAADAAARIGRDLEATRRNVAAAVAQGQADLERQWAQREGIVGLVQGVASAAAPLTGGLDPGWLVAAAAGAFGLGRAGRKALADKTWDEAQKELKPDPTAQALASLTPVLVALLGGRGQGAPVAAPASPAPQAAATPPSAPSGAG
jgi:hypothetical protein